MLIAGSTVAGIGFTVSLLISSLAFHGRQLAEAKLGVLAAAIVAPARGRRRVRRRAPAPRAAACAPDGGHRGARSSTSPRTSTPRATTSAARYDAPVTLVEYGDFECPYCGQAESVIRELLDSFGDELRYVWRHLPLNDVHPRAQLAAEASEAAAAQGRFWEFYDALLAHQDALDPPALGRYAEELGLDLDRFWEELRRHEHAPARRRGRRERRRQRRLRHPHVLHQRAPALRRLRRRDAHRRRSRGAAAFARRSARSPKGAA